MRTRNVPIEVDFPPGRARPRRPDNSDRPAPGVHAGVNSGSVSPVRTEISTDAANHQRRRHADHQSSRHKHLSGRAADLRKRLYRRRREEVSPRVSRTMTDAANRLHCVEGLRTRADENVERSPERLGQRSVVCIRRRATITLDGDPGRVTPGGSSIISTPYVSAPHRL